MANPQDYTVGWICALTTEFVTAQAFLDEEHEGTREVAQNDNNNYALGRIGNHNIVIAVLPDGEYGTAVAAAVARDMLGSFPNIRIGLLVGIAGGAPSPNHDIRLGDIVVSSRDGGKGGVFQYDFGKTIQNQSFQETQVLDQPPMVLRAAVSALKGRYDLKGHQLNEDVDMALNKIKKRKKYSRPPASSDILYRSDITHPSNSPEGCIVVCGDDPSHILARAERDEEDDNPAIHYGLIASANQLMKDALVRDKLAAEKGVLCFEMEAAGLMNHFPCLVIRGICDYSDSHKNKEWQGYAAMTAAAYAKDLLRRITPKRIETEKKISEVISGLQDEVSATSRKADTIIRHQQTQEHKEILNWLTAVDYGPQQSDYLGRRQPGTGQWLLDTVQFHTWRDFRGQTLFCPGIPGSGKTILTSIVIDNLEKIFKDDKYVGIAYVYCNFRRQDEQTVTELLASLLKQLVQSLPVFPECVKSLYNKHKDNRSRPPLEETSSTLGSIAKLYSRVFVLIDALDECRASDGSRKRLLAEVFNLGVNIFATSRFIPQITELFEDSISLEIRATDEDVRRYLDNHMSQLPASVRRSPELQEAVTSEIVRSVGGMFLLAQLHLESLIGKTSVKAVHSALKELPSGSDAYDDAYDTAMKRIEEQVPGHRDLAKQILLWITCAKRPLTTVELRHALAIEVGAAEFGEDALPEIEDMVLVCVGLVTIDEQSEIIRLVHYTTQQYFDKNRGKWFSNAEADITATCATYLSFDVFEGGFCRTDEAYKERMRSNPFYDYSAHYWGNHARESPTLCQEVIDFLESDAKVESSSQALMTEEWWMHSQNVPRQMTGLHLAAYFGIRDGMQILTRRNIMDRRDSHGRTPLSWAAERGHEDIVKLLLGTGKVDIDSQDKNGRTPLSWAAQAGSGAIVKLLLDTGKVDVDAKDQSGRTPLSWAAKNGWCSTAKLLVESGADVKGTGGTGWTTLLTIMPRVVWQVTNFFWWERKGCCLYCAVGLGEGNIL